MGIERGFDEEKGRERIGFGVELSSLMKGAFYTASLKARIYGFQWGEVRPRISSLPQNLKIYREENVGRGKITKPGFSLIARKDREDSSLRMVTKRALSLRNTSGTKSMVKSILPLGGKLGISYGNSRTMGMLSILLSIDHSVAKSK